jgi:YebC/PmpR family DNA-binding regulatory protein
MAGHSKWKNIQHRKGAQDAKRGKVFTKIAKEITVAARMSGGDPDTNAKLRLLLMKARSANMPKDNIERAIKKGTGEAGGADYSEKVYEGYGPGGIAFLVECLTDNVNRTVGEVRHAFTRSGGNMGTEGSVAYLFKPKGLLIYERSKIEDFDAFFEKALEAGAEDIDDDGESVEISCEPGAFQALVDALETFALQADFSEITQVPDVSVAVEEEKKEKINKLIEVLEDLDDVQSVYHNAEDV